MTTSSLQFGPEWMRKGPSNASKPSSNAGNGAAQQSSTGAPTPTTTAAAAPTGTTAAVVNPRRNHVAGLGAMQSNSSSGAGGAGPLPVTTPTTVPSPGGFSFAAAAAGGTDRSAHTPGSVSTGGGAGGGGAAGTGGVGVNGSSSAAAAAALHQQSLSLYSSKEGSRGPLSPAAAEVTGGSDTLPPSAQNAGTGTALQGRRKLFPERERDRDRDSRRSQSSHEAGTASGQASSTSEPPRGLNARGTSVSRDRDGEHRPGLLQRANSSGHFGGATLPSSTTPRERFSGIQGGVLSGVVPPERRRRESGDVKLASGESRKHPPLPSTTSASTAVPPTPSNSAESGTLWERRASGRNVASSADTSEVSEVPSVLQEKPVLEGLRTSVEAGDQSTSLKSANTPASASWSSARRRERAPGEGPIGPPADGSAGFGKFATYERKRERMANHSTADAWRASPTSASLNASVGEHPNPEDEARKMDPHAEDTSSALDGLTIADDESAVERAPSHEPPSQPPVSTWSADTQNWLYRDPSGQVQGPFAATLMQEWYQQSYFNDDLLIRPEEQADFHRLIDVIAAGGHLPQPFLSPPPLMGQSPPDHPHRQEIDNVPSLQAAGTSLFVAPQVPQHQSNNGWSENGPWQAAPPQQQQQYQQQGFVSSPFDTGSGALGGSPFLPYPTGGDRSLDAKLRQQGEYLTAIRMKEMEQLCQREQAHHEQQQAVHPSTGRGLTFGEFPAMDNFVAGWQPTPQQQQPWGSGQAVWPQGREDVAEAHPAEVPQAPAWGNEAVNENIRPIGTPSRARSPDTQNIPVATPEDKSTEPDQEQPVVTTEPAARPVTPEPEDPAPEHEWPQSPSAVEFADEPDMTQSASQERETQATRGAAKSVPGSNLPSTARSAAGGNVRVVGADQFRKTGATTPRSGSEAPLSSFLPGSSGPNSASSTPAKVAPWAQQATQGQDRGSGETVAKSLREIQEAEARQAEARRSLERAAAVQRRANSNVATSDTTALPSTMSWGLASIPSSATAKVDTNPSSSAQQPAAWTDAANSKGSGPVKKSLTEIQEEERKRAQNLQQLKQNQNTAARKAYLESATRQPPAATAAASGWSVVGAGGKAATPAATPTPTPATTIPPRPAVVGATGKKQTSATKIPGVAGAWGATTSTSSVTNGGPIAIPASIPAKPLAATRKTTTPSSTNASTNNTTTAGSSGPSTTSPSSTPSPEFIKYCHEQLKGLNVKVDDFIEMLLSLPLDPSPDVVDIIADTIYANSSTMDGRRIANDFVAKRKMDAGVRGDVGVSLAASSSSSAASSGKKGSNGFGASGGNHTSNGGSTGIASNANGTGTSGGANLNGLNRTNVGGSGSGGGGGNSSSTKHSSAAGQNGFQQVVKKGGKRK